ncbi:ROK family protein [Vibrio lamellibrachiae]|uniref:ROK family transcriptional regulator n=1 Tax=Vibrio lamellibrachiae TaxID=2910253 RepID=UPI003D0F84A8
MLTPLKPLQIELTPGQKKLLTICRNQGPISRAKISEETGLRSGTVTSLSKELLAMNLIKEGERVRIGRGQPTIPLELNPYAAFSFGIAFHIYRIEVALANFSGEIIDSITLNYKEQESVTNVLEMLHSKIDRLIDKHRLSHARILGVGVSMPGPHKGNGKYIHTINWLSQWRDQDLAQLFGDKFEWPVWIDNDCNVAVVGEYFSGLWPEAKNMMLFELGHGVGTGVIINGNLYRGKYQNAGEIGVYFSNFCGPHRPSLRELLRRLEQHGEPISDIANLPGLDHPVVSEWIEFVAEKMAPVILLSQAWFDPDCIIIGGSCPTYLSQAIIDKMGLEHMWKETAFDYGMASLSPSQVGKELNTLGACMYPVFRTLGE